MTTITEQHASGSLAFARWDDPAAADGFETYSDDTLVWLTPILGPTSTLLLHRIGWYHAAAVAFWIADVDRLAAALGVATGQLRQTLLRLENFGMITAIGKPHRRAPVSPSSRRWIAGYPEQLRDICPWWV